MNLKVPIKALSINDCWQGKRFKTNKYKRYEQEFSLLIQPKKFEKMLGDLEVTIKWKSPTVNRGDIDNPVKPILDILTKMGAWEDDRQIQKLTVYKEKSIDYCIEIDIQKCG